MAKKHKATKVIKDLSKLGQALKDTGILPYEGERCFSDAELIRFSDPYRELAPDEALEIHNHCVDCKKGCVEKLDAALDVTDVAYDFDFTAGLVDESVFDDEDADKKEEA